MHIPSSIKALLDAGALAHLVTINRDGSPHVTLVWMGVEDDELVAAHLPKNQKVMNVLRNPQVVVSLEAKTLSSFGLTEYAVLYGTARITEGGAPELLQKLAHVYMGPEAKFPPMPNPPPGYITRIKVERIEGVGPWVRKMA